MKINLFHNHYNQQHLDEVTEEMKKRGTAKIRAIWSEMYGEWLAVEGCHRIRAAAKLGMGIEIEDVTNLENVTIQIDDEDTIVSVADLTQELQDEAYKKDNFRF